MSKFINIVESIAEEFNEDIDCPYGLKDITVNPHNPDEVGGHLLFAERQFIQVNAMFNMANKIYSQDDAQCLIKEHSDSVIKTSIFVSITPLDETMENVNETATASIDLDSFILVSFELLDEKASKGKIKASILKTIAATVSKFKEDIDFDVLETISLDDIKIKQRHKGGECVLGNNRTSMFTQMPFRRLKDDKDVLVIQTVISPRDSIDNETLRLNFGSIENELSILVDATLSQLKLTPILGIELFTVDCLFNQENTAFMLTVYVKPSLVEDGYFIGVNRTAALIVESVSGHLDVLIHTSFKHMGKEIYKKVEEARESFRSKVSDVILLEDIPTGSYS